MISQLVREKYRDVYQCLMAEVRASGFTILISEVEDALQEAFILLYNQWPLHKDNKNLPGWVYLAALHNLKNRRRKLLARSKTVTASLDDDYTSQQATYRLAQLEAAREAQWENLQEMLDGIRQYIGEEDFDFLLQYVSKEKPVKQMAQEMNVSESALWKRKQRIMEKIRSYIINTMLTMILSGILAPVTLMSEGGMGDAGQDAKINGEQSGDQGGGQQQQEKKTLSPEGAKVVASFLENLSPDAFDDTAWELLMTCYRITDEQFGKDPVDVEKAVREHKKRLARYKAQMRKEAKGTRHLSRRAAVALILAACLVLAGAVCYGLGWTPWRIFTWQDEEHYNFTIYTQYDSATDPYTAFQPTGLDQELDRLLQEYEIYLPLPTWIPEGYGKPEFEIDVVDMMIAFRTYFPKEDYYLAMVIYKDLPGSEGVTDGYMEKDDDYYEEYTVEGETFVIVSNMGRLQAKWFEQPYQCMITGRITPDEMHSILDSIFERS